MSSRIINHLLFANFVGGSVIFLQCFVPISYIKNFNLFVLYIIGMAFIFIALCIWIATLFLRTSRMQAKYPPSKVGIGFGIGIGFLFVGAIFVLIYNFTADLPVKFEVIRNMLYMLMTASGFVVLTSSITTLLLVKSQVQPLDDEM